jgi:hypothetical protein
MSFIGSLQCVPRLEAALVSNSIKSSMMCPAMLYSHSVIETHMSLRSKSTLWPASLLPPHIMVSRVSSADRDAWWTSIKLVLDLLFTFPSEALHTDVLHSVTPAAYSDTYTAAFKWAHTGAFGVLGPLPYMDGNHELYMLLDHLLGERCQILYPQLTSLAGKELLQA